MCNVNTNSFRRLVPAIVGIGMGICSTARADVIYQAAGVVDSVHQQITSIEVGDIYQMPVTVDESTPDSWPAQADAGRYNDLILSYSFDIGGGAYSYSGAPGSPLNNTLEVNDGTGGFMDDDVLNLYDDSIPAPILDGLDPSGTRLFIVRDDSGTALSSDAIPAAFPPISSWSSATWNISFTDGVYAYGVDGYLTDLAVVPEPASALLVVLGGVAAVMRRRRQVVNR